MFINLAPNSPSSPGSAGARLLFNRKRSPCFENRNVCILFCIAADPQRLFNDLRARPEVLQQLGQRDPGLVRAVESNDISTMKDLP